MKSHVLLFVVCAVCVAAAQSKPNVLILFVDDMGWQDVEAFGRKNVSTPHINSLAARGLKLTQWISAAPICTPSRVALQTGRLATRVGMTANVLPFRVFDWPSQSGGLPEEEYTIAEALRDDGYATGMAGKWHLGINEPGRRAAHLPLAHGYDTWLGLPFTNMHACAMGHEEPGFCMLMANHTVVEQPTQMQNITSELTRHAVDFITETSNRAQPWFYLMSYIHVHSPIFTSPAFTGVSAGGRFGDTVEELDDSVGQILQALSDAGVADNTFVLFTSDNGPFAEEGYDTCGRTGGLKGSKGQTYEGGVRVPGIAMWPGKIPAGTVSDELISTLDIFPTVIAAVGISSSSSSFSSFSSLSVPVGLDGVNALPLLLDPKNEKSAHTFFWHYCGKNVTAARHQGLKFHFATQIWGTDAKPSPKCTECCPDGPTSFNGTGGSLCDCGSGDLVLHNPPLVFNMTSDRTESNPLTPAEVPDLAARVAAVKAALVLHYAGVQPVKDQMHTLPDIALKPCCTAAGGGNVTPGPFTKCFCRDYTPGKSYP